MSMENSTVALSDIEAFKVMLENAEIQFEEVNLNENMVSIEIENGMSFHFDDGGKLEAINE